MCSSDLDYSDLHDCSNDIAAVIEADGKGPAIMVGHAFGNRVSRLLATIRPDLVKGVVLVAANVGHAPSPPKIREAIRNSADPSLPPHVRLDALRLVFFAPGNDPSSWLHNWYPDVLAAQRHAGDQENRWMQGPKHSAVLTFCPGRVKAVPGPQIRAHDLNRVTQRWASGLEGARIW